VAGEKQVELVRRVDTAPVGAATAGLFLFQPGRLRRMQFREQPIVSGNFHRI
jgi:hypothetical protein